MFAELRPSLAEFRRIWHARRFHQVLGDVGRSWPEFDQVGQNSTNFGPDSTVVFPNSSQGGPIRRNFVFSRAEPRIVNRSQRSEMSAHGLACPLATPIAVGRPRPTPPATLISVRGARAWGLLRVGVGAARSTFIFGGVFSIVTRPTCTRAWSGRQNFGASLLVLGHPTRNMGELKGSGHASLGQPRRLKDCFWFGSSIDQLRVRVHMLIGLVSVRLGCLRRGSSSGCVLDVDHGEGRLRPARCSTSRGLTSPWPGCGRCSVFRFRIWLFPTRSAGSGSGRALRNVAVAAQARASNEHRQPRCLEPSLSDETG